MSSYIFSVVPAVLGGNLVTLLFNGLPNDTGFPPKTAGMTGSPGRGRLDEKKSAMIVE